MELWNRYVGSDVVWGETLLGHVQSRRKSLCPETYVFILRFRKLCITMWCSVLLASNDALNPRFLIQMCLEIHFHSVINSDFPFQRPWYSMRDRLKDKQYGLIRSPSRLLKSYQNKIKLWLLRKCKDYEKTNFTCDEIDMKASLKEK